jgi:hypothetical protein
MVPTATVVGTLDGGYVLNVPLPRVPQVQSASLMTGGDTFNTCYSQIPRVPTWGNIARLLVVSSHELRRGGSDGFALLFNYG